MKTVAIGALSVGNDLPLTFIAIVVPLIDSRARLAAALVAGTTAVLLAGLPWKTGLFFAALAGLAAGAFIGERRP